MDVITNSVELTLAGEKRTMKATFGALRAIERDIGKGIVSIISTMGNGEISFTDAATIIFHGLRGNGDNRMSLDQVGEALVADGLSKFVRPLVDFLGIALRGADMGKPEAEAK